MYNDNFLIGESDLDFAKDICKLIDDESLRNRAVADVIAANFAKKYFEDIEIDTKSGLHNIYQVLENIDISDIYIKNNYIDVRLYFNENELYVPKSHFDNNLLPVAYMFIKIDEEFSGAVVTGFITPSLINTDELVKDYYKVNENDLISFYDIEPLLELENEIELTKDINAQIFDYLDNRLADKKVFYRILLKSQEARELLRKAAYAKTVFNFVSVSNELVDDVQREVANIDEDVTDVGLEEVDVVDLDIPMSLDEQKIDFLSSDENAENLLQEVEVDESMDFVSDSNFDEVECVSDDESVDLLFPENNIADNFDNSIDLIDATDDVVEETAQELDLSNESLETLDVETSSILQSEDCENLTEELLVQEEDVPNPDDVEFAELLETENNEVNTSFANESLKEDVLFEDFSTNVTPSITSYEEIESVNNVEDVNTDEKLEFDDDDSTIGTEQPELESELEASTEIDVPEVDKEDHINDLFTDVTNADENFEQQDEVEYQEVSKKRTPLIPLVGVVAGAAILGYYSYTKFIIPQNEVSNKVNDLKKSVQIEKKPTNSAPIEAAMPVETVENVKLELNSNEGTAVSVPAIEQNIDATISVTNLRVEFEVPAAYKTSKTAERYFTKIGKLIQINLKTELLLLTKQPITNRIAVELEYNKMDKCFDVKGLSASSGEKIVDDVVLKTVKSALSRNLNMNLSSLGSIQGNPVLIIKL